MAVTGRKESVFWEVKEVRDNPFWAFFRVLCFGHYFGQISLYSFELGFGFKVVSGLWWFSWGLIVSISICCCRQFADKRSLHVVWYVWSMVLEWDSFHSSNWYTMLSKLSRFSLVACGREIGLEVGPIRLMNVIIISDEPVTIVLN